MWKGNRPENWKQITERIVVEAGCHSTVQCWIIGEGFADAILSALKSEGLEITDKTTDFKTFQLWCLNKWEKEGTLVFIPKEGK